MFIFEREKFNEMAKGKKVYRMASFYQKARRDLNILMDKNDQPVGGKWSFDEENRKKIPKDTLIPSLPSFKDSIHKDDVIKVISKYFHNHPGELTNLWFPVSRKDAKKQLDEFIKNRFLNFGIYEDAMLEGENFLFHSCISSLLNIGLLTPSYVIERSIKLADKYNVPINSLEGFIRQIIGWREFIRGIYQEEGEYQIKQNYWNHKNKLTDAWYEGETGIIPLDDAIKTTIRDLNILMDKNDQPVGGKWSFDEENRKKIPKDTLIPSLPSFKDSIHKDDVIKVISKYFHNHPGELTNLWFPVSRKDAKKQLDEFIKNRFLNFGIYEDAMLEGENFLFHSCISSLLNIGLLTPSYVIERSIKLADKYNVPINSLEGFIRQIIGWREFIRGIYQEEGEYQIKQNYWNHKNKLTDAWYEGETGIIPLDDAIKTTIRDGYVHHIPRLMVISNIMNLCEIHPDEIYKWFMEMYIDSSDWVMVPNVYGMATYADGGLMSTKPYTCGSNYILKMSNYKKGEWCDTLDGLYWRFTEKNRDFYESNPRLSLLTRSLDKMDPQRKKKIFGDAEKFIKSHTK